jgi:hypothetical protein
VGIFGTKGADLPRRRQLSRHRNTRGPWRSATASSVPGRPLRSQ